MKFISKIAFAFITMVSIPNLSANIIHITKYTSPEDVKDKVTVFLDTLRQAGHLFLWEKQAKISILSEVIADWDGALTMTEAEHKELTEITQKEIRHPDGSCDQHKTIQYLLVKPDQTAWTDDEITDFVAFATTAKDQFSQDLEIANLN